MENKIDCKIREHNNKGDNHRLRVSGRVPGVIYGLNRSNLNVEFAELDLIHTLAATGDHGVLEIDTNGTKEKMIIKEIQREPITRKLMHIDLQRIDANKKIHTLVPIMIKGEDVLKGKDALVQRQADEIEIECKPDDIPKYLTVDVSKMDPGKRITYSDIEIASEISIIGDANTIIATVGRRKLNEAIDEEMHPEADTSMVSNYQ